MYSIGSYWAPIVDQTLCLALDINFKQNRHSSCPHVLYIKVQDYVRKYNRGALFRWRSQGLSKW